LIDSQQPDGGWPTTGQGISNANTPARRKKVEPIYRFWGTAWAAIGLATSLPAVDGNRRDPAPTGAAVPPGP
jgi:hypothetical protein